MISTTDPESMTADERRLEVASILASGLLRRVRMEKRPNRHPEKQSRKGLEARVKRSGLAVPPASHISGGES